MAIALDPEQRRQITDALLDGHTVTQVARMLDVKRSRVEAIAQKMRAEGLKVMRSPQGKKRKAA